MVNLHKLATCVIYDRVHDEPGLSHARCLRNQAGLTQVHRGVDDTGQNNFLDSVTMGDIHLLRVQTANRYATEVVARDIAAITCSIVGRIKNAADRSTAQIRWGTLANI